MSSAPGVHMDINRPLTPCEDDVAGGRAELGAARARDRVFALLSHEIRTPLNGVLGMAGLLAGTPLDATQAAYLATLRDCGEHLLGLVNNMLDLAKLEAGRIELEPADTDVEALLQGVSELLSPRAHAKGLEIAWSVAPGLGVIRADDGALRQILFNLAGNAVKLTETGGVWLRAERRGGTAARPRIRFAVADSGPGLKPEDQARIFEEFAQAEAGVRAGGAGLGLAIVRRLAAALGGVVGVESTPGSGATFWVEASFDAVNGSGCSDDLHGLTIAVETTSWVVRDAAAAQVRACGGQLAQPSEACDVRLVDACEEIAPPPPGAPALVLLTPEARDRIEAFRSAGYAGYLIKPLRRASLATRVRAALAKEGREDPGDERAAPARLEGLRVLLAEDNPVNALLARALLTRCGCSVLHVGGGEEALAAARAAAYDVVLLDMRMPDLDGPATARALRAAGFRLPIVALTANAFADDRRLCLEAGMDGFLTKPLQPAALEAELARWRGASVG
jgi:CheY-like chemotaxis protein